MQLFSCTLILNKGHGHQLGPMTHFLSNPKFDPLSYIWDKSLFKDFKCSLCVPTFIYMGQISVQRFQMLPLCALIHDLEKKGGEKAQTLKISK